MRELATLHKDVLSEQTSVDMDRIQKCTYLHEIDNEVQ